MGFAVNKAGDGLNSATIPGQPGTPKLIQSSSTNIHIKWDPTYDDGESPQAILTVHG